MSDRRATFRRDTRESQVEVTLDLDGTGQASVDTPNGMLNHLLEQLARHGLMDVSVTATGDLSPGWHHLVEDVGIVLGRRSTVRWGRGRASLAWDTRWCPWTRRWSWWRSTLGAGPTRW